jgi:hypothetical protein
MFEADCCPERKGIIEKYQYRASPFYFGSLAKSLGSGSTTLHIRLIVFFHQLYVNTITFKVPGGVAETSGQLLQGDQIISVNSIDLEKATQVEYFYLLLCIIVGKSLTSLKYLKLFFILQLLKDSWKKIISKKIP